MIAFLTPYEVAWHLGASMTVNLSYAVVIVAHIFVTDSLDLDASKNFGTSNVFFFE